MTALLLGVTVITLCLVARRWLVPIRRRRNQERYLRLQHARGLPAAVVLMQVAVRGGSHPRRALARVSELDVGRGALDEVIVSLSDVQNRLELGADFASAMLLTSRGSADLYRVLDALRRAEVDGGPLALHLDVLVSDLRRQRRTVLDGAAQRLTVSMLFPLVVCILPAFVLLAVVPLLQAALRGLPG